MQIQFQLFQTGLRFSGRLLRVFTLLALPLAARAQIVTTTADSGAGSLRATIAAASSGATITFSFGLSGQTITLTSGEILLNKNLTIDASALAAGITINGNGASRAFVVPVGVFVTLKSLTLTNCFANAADGGAINNSGTLSLQRCSVLGNTASASGGAIFNAGTLILTESTIAGNTSASYGGGIENYGTVTVNQSTFTANLGGGGGAIDNNGVVNANQSTFASNNISGNTGGAIWAGGSVTLSNCTVVGNLASGGGAGGIQEYGTAAIRIVNSIVALNQNANLIGNITNLTCITNGDPVLLPLGNYGGVTQAMPPGGGSPAIDASGPVTSTVDQRGFARAVGTPDIGAVELQTAETFYTTVYTNANSGPYSLRGAIAGVNPGSTITFAPNLNGQTITLTSGELAISKSLIILGPGANNLAVSGNFSSRIFNIGGGCTLNLSGLTIRNGRAGNGASSGTPGVPGNPGGNGGGIFNAGTLNLTNCIITSSSGGTGGDGYPPVNPAPTPTTPGGLGGNGGGIYNQNILRIYNSTIHGNSGGLGGYGGFGNWGTNAGGTGGHGGDGGGIYSAGGSVLIQSSTIANNSGGPGGAGGNAGPGGGGNPGAGAGSGGSGGNGGAIYSLGSFTIVASTISGSVAGSGGSGGFGAFGGAGGGASGIGGGVYSVGGVTSDSSIFANNTAATAPDVYGPFSSAGHNLVGKSDYSGGFGAPGDIIGSSGFPVNAQLSPLANNGGSTLTMALGPTSPALDAGNDALAASLVTDQRGAARSSGTHMDIGAYELNLALLSTPTIVMHSIGGVTINPTTHFGSATVTATINPNGLASTAWLKFGLTTSYGSATTPQSLGASSGNVVVNLPLDGLAPGQTWHYRVGAANAAGTIFGADQTVTVSVPGDLNGDGIVSQAELNDVYGNYVTNSPWLYMTNVAGLGGTNVSFTLTNSLAGVYTVEYSTNLTDWLPLGPATPRHEFTDTNAPAVSQRYYRLRYP